MTTATLPSKTTPQQLLAMPDAKSYELVDGELVKRNMGWNASRIASELLGLLQPYCRQHRLGWVVMADAGYQCFPDDPDKVRKPDVSFIRLDRMPAEDEPQGHCRIAPDLVVEIISPNDLYQEVDKKVREYLAAGVRLVWVINPTTKVAHVHRPDGSGADLTETDTLDGEQVVPGFRCKVGDLFLTPG